MSVHSIKNIDRRLSETLSAIAHDTRYTKAALSEVIAFVNETAAEALSCARVSAWSYSESDGKKITCLDLWDRRLRQHTQGMSLRNEDARSYLSALNRDTVLVMHDVFTDPLCRELAVDYLPSHGITSMLDAPFQFDGELAGVICFEHVGPKRYWSDEEVYFCRAMASLLSIAVEAEQRRKAENDLKEEEERYRGLVNNLPNGLLIIVDEKIVFANSMAAAMAQVPNPEDLNGTDISEFLDGEALASAQSRRDAIVSTHDSLAPVAYRFRTRTGDVRDIEISSSYINWNAQDAIQSILRDVTEQKKAEGVAQKSEQQFRILAESFPGGFTYNDSELRYKFINQAYCDWIGLRIEDMIGKTLAEVAGEKNFAEVRDYIDQVLAGRNVTFERRTTYPNAGTRDVQISYVPDFDSSGQVRGFFALVTDVTEIKQTEATLQHAHRMNAVGQLTGGVAHDFNNLLQIIGGAAEILHDMRDKPEEQQAWVQKIADSVARGSSLTGQLLAFSRQQKLSPVIISPVTVVGELEQLLQRTLSEDIELRVEFGADLPDIFVDVHTLQNALINLCVNARGAMPEGGRLSIEVERHGLDADIKLDQDVVAAGDYLRIAVRDTGTGMSSEVLAKAFDPFFTTKEVGQGTGLGLSMVYGFARQSGGLAEIDSAPGEGCCVTILLPAHEPPSEPRHSAPAAQDNPAGEGTILVVEDDPDVRATTRAVLEHIGYTVLEAGSGAIALEILDGRSDIDVVFSDVVMPAGISGFDLARRLLAHQGGPRVLLTSGYPETVAAESGASIKDIPIVAKPFTRAELHEALTRLMGHRGPAVDNGV